MRFVDKLDLDVRLCCRNFNAFFPLSKISDHCHLESNAGGNRKTWELYGREVLMPDGTTRKRLGIPAPNDNSDNPSTAGTKCGPWYDCSGCLDRAMQNYPTEDYSEFQANVGMLPAETATRS
jgi:hypothetical protein